MYLNTFINLEENINGYGKNKKKPTGHVIITTPGMIRVYVQDLKEIPNKKYICYGVSKRENRAIRLGEINPPNENKMTNWKEDIGNVRGKGIPADHIDCVAIVVEGDSISNTDTVMIGYTGEKYLITPLLEKELPRKDKTPVSKPVPKPETKPTPSPEVKPVPKPETKPTPPPEVKPVPKPETKPTPPPVVKPVPKPETKPTPPPEVKPVPKPETKPTPPPEVKPVPKPETKPTPPPVVKPVPKPETKPTPPPEVKPVPKPKPPVVKPVPIPGEGPGPVIIPKPMPKPKPPCEKEETHKKEICKEECKEKNKTCHSHMKSDEVCEEHKHDHEMYKYQEPEGEGHKHECKEKKHNCECDKNQRMDISEQIQDIINKLSSDQTSRNNLQENLQSQLINLISNGISKEAILSKRNELEFQINNLVNNKLDREEKNDVENISEKLKALLNEQATMEETTDRACANCQKPQLPTSEEHEISEEDNFLEDLETKLKSLQSLLQTTLGTSDQVSEEEQIQEKTLYNMESNMDMDLNLDDDELINALTGNEEYDQDDSELYRAEEYSRVREIFEDSDRIVPFENGEQNIDWVRISLSELLSIPQLNNEWATQPVITGGYYKFKHLILGKDKDAEEYYVGIPDIYHPSRSSILDIDKIERFTCRHSHRLATGEPGYWIAKI